MKNLRGFLMTLGVLMGATAFANDGGMAYIDVKGIDPGALKGDKDGVKVYGKGARALFELLPATESVTPQWDPHFRSLGIVSDHYNLILSCSDAKPDYQSGSLTPLRDGVVCSIQVYSVEPEYKYDLLGGAFPFDRKTQVCNK